MAFLLLSLTGMESVLEYSEEVDMAKTKLHALYAVVDEDHAEVIAIVVEDQIEKSVLEFVNEGGLISSISIFKQVPFKLTQSVKLT